MLFISLSLRTLKTGIFLFHLFKTLATIQGKLLWRAACLNDTLATTYQAEEYNNEHSGRSDSIDRQPPSQIYTSRQRSGLRQQSYRSADEQSGTNSSPGLHEHVRRHTGNSSAQHSSMLAHQNQMMMDPNHLAQQHLDPDPYSNSGTLAMSFYSSLPTLHHTVDIQPEVRVKRRRSPGENDAGNIGHLSHSHEMEVLHQPTLRTTYEEDRPDLGQVPPTHHHHHLPGSTSSPWLQRREDGSGGAPNMVGQPGMPEPAPQPRGPKLKFTPEDDLLLVNLKEQHSLTWKQIADFFPGRTSGTLQVRYCTKLKAKETLWTDETDQKLRIALQDYDNEKWRIVAGKLGPGFSSAACRERAEVLLLTMAVDGVISASPSSTSAAELNAPLY